MLGKGAGKGAGRREKKEEEGRTISNLLDIFHLHRDERQTKNESVSLCGSQNNESEISSFNLLVAAPRYKSKKWREQKKQKTIFFIRVNGRQKNESGMSGGPV